MIFPKSLTAMLLKSLRQKRIKFWTFSFNADLHDGVLGRDVLPKAEGGAKWKEEHGRIEILVSRKREQEAGHEPRALHHGQQEGRKNEV